MELTLREGMVDTILYVVGKGNVHRESLQAIKTFYSYCNYFCYLSVSHEECWWKIFWIL